MQSTLALYVTPMCGFCHWVISQIQELGIEVEIRDIYMDENHREALYNARGRLTVPVLRINAEDNEQWMPESRDIVAYLQGLKAAAE